MPIPQKLQGKFQQKELTISLQTTQYETARSKANFLEHKILTELFPMHDALQTVTVDKTIRKFLLASLKLYDTFAQSPSYQFNPPSSLFDLKRLQEQLKTKKAKDNLQRRFDETVTMYGTTEPIENTFNKRIELLYKFEEAHFQKSDNLTPSDLSALLALEALDEKLGDKPYRWIKFGNDGEFLFSTHTPEKPDIMNYLQNADSTLDINQLNAEERRSLISKAGRAIELLQKLYNALLDGDPRPNDAEFEDILAEHFNGSKPLTITEDFDRYFAEKNLAPATERKKRDSLKLFVALWGDVPTHKISSKTAISFKQQLMKLPLQRDGKYSNFSLKEILQNTKPSDEKLAHSTINNHLSSFTSFFNWARTNCDLVEKNPFTGLSVPRRAKLKKKPFDETDLKKFFSCPIYKGCASRGRRLVSGNNIYKEAFYWIPLLALYTGARLNEIADLPKSAIKQHAATGIWLITLEEEDRTLKTDSSYRVIPLHKDLITLGFIDFLKNSRSANKLFDPYLDASKVDEQLSRAYGQAVNRDLKDLGINTNGQKTFHSFRHTLKKYMREAEIPRDFQNFLLGHKGDSVGDSYGMDDYVKLKKKYIDLIVFSSTQGLIDEQSS